MYLSKDNIDVKHHSRSNRSHKRAATDHEAAAQLHRKAAEHHEQNKMDDARTSAKNALAGSDKAHKQSVTAWQGSAK